MDSSDPFFGAPVVHRYTRAQAIADGVLVDVTQTARQARIRLPVALTAGVWSECVSVPAGVVGQDEVGRLWDVVYVLSRSLPARLQGGDVVPFRVHARNSNAPGLPPLVDLHARVDGGDDGLGAITVTLPTED